MKQIVFIKPWIDQGIAFPQGFTYQVGDDDDVHKIPPGVASGYTHYVGDDIIYYQGKTEREIDNVLPGVEPAMKLHRDETSFDVINDLLLAFSFVGDAFRLKEHDEWNRVVKPIIDRAVEFQERNH